MTQFLVSPARRAALSVLQRASDPKAPGVDVLLDERCVRESISREDAALARQIVFGVLRRRMALEAAVACHLRHPVPDPAVHLALLCGAFQHYCLDRVPPHALVNETVELVAKQKDGGRYRGLANAVMRKVVEQPRSALSAGAWTVDCSVPDWLLDEAARVLPDEELEPFFRSSNEPAPLCLRACTGRMPVEQLERELAEAGAMRIERSRHVPGCVIAEGARADDLPSFKSGACTVEDEGAQIACLLAGPRGGERRILDLCASPGGKTTHLADLVSPDCTIVATDVSERKLERLRATVNRLGLSQRVRIDLADRVIEQDTEGFDLVLVDAPCSGLGTMRRHPEARWRRSPEGTAELAALQGDLLETASRLVRPGGTLAYSVCTWTASETIGRVESFLHSCKHFARADAPPGLPFDPSEFRDGNGVWRTWPHRQGCDGFAVARFERSNSA